MSGSGEWRPNTVADQKVHAAAVRAVQDAADTVLQAAKANTPVLTGALRDSGEVTMDGPLHAVIAFTDPISVIVHEDMTAHHEHGEAKYLERAMTTDTEKILAAAAKALRAAIGT